MSPALLGNLALGLALVVCAAGLVGVGAALRLRSSAGMRTARWSLPALWICLTLACLALAGALLDRDFSISYVARHVELALPAGYRLAALWAGQEGSLLLWAWLSAGMAALWAVAFWRGDDVRHAVTGGVLLVLLTFFSILLLYVPTASPFVTLAEVPPDGQGLNPLLQDPAMIAHPPALFLGYAGFSMPLAILLGALAAGRRDNLFAGEVRLWSLAAWLFLTVGILLGAWWAYIELGWGGYWAWDPVENASLLPWLTGTALVHSIGVQQQRGMLKRLSALLVCASFALCILATFITRSGVVQSVHSFGRSTVGHFFLAFLIAVIIGSAAVMVWRRRLLVSDRPLETVWGREGMFLAAGTLLILMTVVVAVGTLLPAIVEVFPPAGALLRLIADVPPHGDGRQPAAGPPFYNSVILPMGLALMAMMALGPLLRYGADAGRAAGRSLAIPLAGGLAGVVAVAILGRGNLWVLAAAFIVGMSLAGMAADLLRSSAQRARTHGENAVVAFVRLIDSNHRRYGGQIVHLGMLMFMAGVVGSALYGRKHEVSVAPGQAVDAGRLTLRLEGLAQKQYRNYTAVEATLLLTDESGRRVTLVPQRRFYHRSNQQTSEIALSSTLLADTYVLLAGVSPDGGTAGFQVLINPLVAWLWLGGLVMTFGGIVCLLPPLLPAGRRSAEHPAGCPHHDASASEVERPADDVQPTASGTR